MRGFKLNHAVSAEGTLPDTVTLLEEQFVGSHPKASSRVTILASIASTASICIWARRRCGEIIKSAVTTSVVITVRYCKGQLPVGAEGLLVPVNEQLSADTKLGLLFLTLVLLALCHGLRLR